MLVVDAGPLVAAISADDRNHRACAELLASAPPPLLVPSLVVAEVSHLLSSRVGRLAEEAFAAAFRDGELVVEPIEPADWIRIVELLGQYSDLNLGIVDASVLTTCERLGADRLATLDRRHFTVVRPRHRDALTLVP